MKNNYTLYMHIFPNNKVYIGITIQKPKQRWKKGKQYNEYMKKAIQKYGWENIKHEILYENLSKEEAEQKEIETIKYYRANERDFGYNISNGGFHQGNVSEETKKKISKANKGKESWCKGKKFTEEQKQQRYNAEFKIKVSQSSKGRKAWNKGIKTNEETKQKISQATRQAMNNPEIRKKISLAKMGKPSPRKGVKLTLEQRKKLSEAHKKDKNKTEINVSNAILGGI